MDDVQLPRQPRLRIVGVLGAELEAVRPIDGERVDVEPLQRLQQRLPRAAEEGDALLDLRRLRRPFEQEDVRQRMPGSDDRDVELVAVARKLVAERVDLGDRLLQVTVVDLVGGHGAHDRSVTFAV